MRRITSTYILLGVAILLVLILFGIVALSFFRPSKPVHQTTTPNPTPILLKVTPIIEGTKKVTISPSPTSLLTIGKKETITFTFSESINSSDITIIFYKRTQNQTKEKVQFTKSAVAQNTLSLQMNEEVAPKTEYNIQVLGPQDPNIKGRANMPVYSAVTYNSTFQTPTPILTK